MDDAATTSQLFLDKAKKAQQSHQYAEAARLATKANRIHHTKEAQQLANLMEEYTKNPPSAASESASASASTSSNTQKHATNHKPNLTTPTQRASAKNTKAEESANESVREYTPEQLTLVRKLKIHITKKEYYKILDIPSNIDQDRIKKAYLKRALLFHPDKNAAPGADECFKAIADAFNILGDVQQRAIFDEQGAAAFEGVRGNASRAGQSTSAFHGFDGFNAGGGPTFQFGGNGQINPEDLFNMFFGGGGGMGGMGGSPFANLHRHRQQQQQRRRQASPNQGNSSPFGVSPILLYAGLILLSTILSGLFFGGDQYNAASTFNTKTAGSYWGSDVFQFQYSRQYRELKQTSRSKVSYYVDPGVYQSFLNTEMPRYKHVPRLAPAPEESKGVPKTRIKLLEQWVDRTWFAVVSDMCSQEERNRATRISQSQWFFGTKEGNEERKKTAEAEVLPYCNAKSIWQKSGKCPAIEKQGYY